tara:strand:- start:846 stop:3827 length:2982 start_codon:yes stop_codon:yes gene_type:complete
MRKLYQVRIYVFLFLVISGIGYLLIGRNNNLGKNQLGIFKNNRNSNFKVTLSEANSLLKKAYELDRKGTKNPKKSILLWERLLLFSEERNKERNILSKNDFKYLSAVYRALCLSSSNNRDLKRIRSYCPKAREYFKKIDPTNQIIADFLTIEAWEIHQSNNILNISLLSRLEEKHKQALSISKRNNNNIEIAKHNCELGNIYFRSSSYYLSEKHTLICYQILSNSLPELDIKLLDTATDLAGIYTILEDVKQANKYLDLANRINIANINPDKPSLYLMNTLGANYASIGQKGKAIEVYKQAIKLSDGIDKNDPILIVIKNNLYNLTGDSERLISNNQLIKLIKKVAYFDSIKEFRKASILLEEVLEIQKKILGEKHIEVADTYNYLALQYWRTNRIDKSESFYKSGLNIIKERLGVKNKRYTDASINFSLLYLSQGRYEKAIAILKDVVAWQVLSIQKNAQSMPLNGRDLYAQYKSSNLYKGIYTGATRKIRGASELAMYARLNRQGLLEEVLKNQSIINGTTRAQKELKNKIRTLTINLSDASISLKARQKFQLELDNLESKFYSELPTIKPKTVEISEVAESLPQGSVLIEYQRYLPFDWSPTKSTSIHFKEGSGPWGDARYLAMILNPNGQVTAIDLGNAAAIDQKIQKALLASQALPEFKQMIDESTKKAEESWNEVSELVIKPLKEGIGDAETLFISPDAELNRIPFAALTSPQGNGLLGEENKIRLLTTGRALLVLGKKFQTTPQQPLVIANPDFNKIINPNKNIELTINSEDQFPQRVNALTFKPWAQLDRTESEGRSIQKLTNARLLMKENATALAIQNYDSPKSLHIASHSFFQETQGEKENPLQNSAIVLAGANKARANSEDDGYLTALEVTKLDWQGTELVVVSGCESGKGDIKAGEGLYGFKRAIAVAGARSSLLSLWKVNDHATAAFMTRFYERLKEGEGRADALAATQKEFRAHRTPEWRHPFVWAAFQLSGDWRPIEF